MSTIRLGSDSFHYELEGPAEAPVLIFSNSLGTSLDLWDHQAEHLRRTYRVLRYDSRGHGQSQKSPGPYTLEQLGRDVLDLADALAIGRFSFCGISMGGLVGQWLAVHAPERVQRLVLCNTAARIGTHQAWIERAAIVRAQGMEAVALGTPARWFTAAYIEREPDKVAHWVDALRRTDVEGYAASCEALAVADLREEIARITAPTLIIAGKQDPATTLSDADVLEYGIAGARRVNLDVSHLSNVELPELFTETVQQFLSDPD